MAKISELTAAGTLTGAEIVPIVQSGATVRTTVTNLLAAAPAVPAVVSDDVLKVDNATLGLDATLRALEDGNGNEAPLQLSTSAVMLTEGAIFPYGHSTRFTSGQTGIILPFYVYPNNPYTDPVVARLLGLIRQYRNVPVIVVVNPDSGPGAVWDGNWAALITVLKAAGACVAGYVSTDYATRPAGDVLADINSWLALYGATPVSTIFFDEQPWNPVVGLIDTVALYKSYTDYCHARNLFPTIGNPGTNQRGEHFETRTADLIIIHEQSTLPTEANLAGNFVGGHVDYPYSLRAALVYGQTTLDPGLVRLLARYVQYIYVTDDILPSPWDSLPAYFEELFALVADYGSPSAGLTRLTYAVSTTWDARETTGASLTLTGNTTMATPTNLISGREYQLVATQDATGGRTLNFSAGYKFEAAISLPLTATANKIHVIKFLYTGTYMLATSVSVYA
jgi:hypothetical protein